MGGVLARVAALSIIVAAMVTAMALASSSKVAQAQERPVTGRALTPDEASAVLRGITVEGEYDNGAAWTETFHRDGRSTYTDDGGTGTGTMRFAPPGVCFAYPDTTGLTGGCFEVWRRGARCFDFYGVANAAGPMDRRFGRFWSARAWTTGGREDCGSDLVS